MWIPFVIVALLIAILTLLVYNHYAPFTTHPLWVPITVLTGFYLSFSIVFLIPIDVSSSMYDACEETSRECERPFTYLDSETLLIVWRVVYWVTYCMCWTVYPILQSYALAGVFGVLEKLKTAIVENLLFYGIAGAILLVLLVIIAAKNRLDGYGMMGIGIAAANAWGLLLVILFLGYGLVEIPRKIWYRASRHQMLKYYQFKAVELHDELLNSQEKLEKILKTVKKFEEQTPEGDPWHPYVQSIIEKCPKEYFDIYHGESDMEITYGNLVKLSSEVKWAAHVARRNQCLYKELLNSAFQTEDILRAQQQGGTYEIGWSFKTPYSGTGAKTVRFLEWLWKVWLEAFALRLASFLCVLMAATVLWSEVTFFSRHDPDPNSTVEDKPSGIDLSIWSILIHARGLSNSACQLFIFLSITYMAICVYWSLFRLRLFNFYRLIPHQQTDPSSLMFCALYLGRLIPPLAHNYLAMIHNPATAFWKLMGNMAVVPILGGTFNTYVPILLAVVVLFTLFNLYSRMAALLRIKRFQFSENINDEQVEEGSEILRRERNKRERMATQEATERNYMPTALGPRRRGRDPVGSKLLDEEEAVDGLSVDSTRRGGRGGSNGSNGSGSGKHGGTSGGGSGSSSGSSVSGSSGSVGSSTRSSGGVGNAPTTAPAGTGAGFGFPSLSKIFSARGGKEAPAGLDEYVNDLEMLASKVERKRRNMNNA
jgi:hypothetical protein